MEQTETSISVLSGRFFDFLRPEEYEYDIEEIATSLSNTCRYTGHVNRFYSVAEHSVLVSRLVPDSLALTGLLHDASEAFTGDIAKPLKELIGPAFKDIENSIEKAIANHFNLPYPFPPEIKVADKQMYWQERQEVANVGIGDSLWNQDRRATRKVEAKGMAPHMARRMFLARYRELTKLEDKEKVVNLYD